MGKVSSLQSQAEPTINHFSHQHPLNLSNHQHPQANFHAMNQSSCSACKLNLSLGSMIYTCRPCNYNLHINCSQMPQQIKHQFHQQHFLSLLPKPAHPEGFFSCDACGKHGDGFSYHCGPCKIDLHIKCASLPLRVSHQSHHHSLYLTFSNPYGNDLFSCDICKNMGSKEWNYRCNLCEFDCHLNCATVEPRSQVLGTQLPEIPNFLNNGGHHGAHGRNYADQDAFTASFHAQKNAILNQIMQGTSSSIWNALPDQNVFFNQIMQGIASNNSTASHQAMQDWIRNSYGGGNGGGAAAASYMQPMMGGGSSVGGISTGGGGAAGNYMQAMMGGGGAGVVQTLLGGESGGGGAGNILQALMDGGGGDSFSGILGNLSGLGGLG